MDKAFMTIGLHNHQPIGNFEHVFSEAYDKCYAPMLEVWSRFPGVRAALHVSGPLLEWTERHKPEYLERIKAMVKTGQLELLGGGFYEPILSALPERDAVGQLEMMNRWLEKRFGVRPRGAWMAERIWDPYMPRILAAAGLEYTLLDDTHFRYAGLGQDDMYGYWVTEKHGNAVAVFPIDKTLRYSLPFKQPEETLDYFRRTVASRGPTGFTYGDDGEKFGVWPETHEWVYGRKWLERFLTMLSQNGDVVETLTFSQYLDRFPPRGRTYLPLSSYEEMMHWALGADAAVEHTHLLHLLEKEGRADRFLRFMRGGVWDNFLAKYPESNQIHKRMLHVSERVARVAEKTKAKKKAKPEMVEALYRGQCNCPYWHGLFGGLYLGNLRHAVYANLIAAGRLADASLHPAKTWVEVRLTDYLKNLRDDVVAETPELFALIAPSQGGALVELDFKRADFNLSNVMSRRPEEYHKKILDAAGKSAAAEGEILSIHDRVVFKEPSLETKLVFDRFPRHSFIDHIFTSRPSADDLRLQKFEEAGDFADGVYAPKSIVEKKDGALALLSREGQATLGGTAAPLRIEKGYRFAGAGAKLKCEYAVTNLGGRPLEFWLGVEWNFTLLAGDALDRYITVSDERYRMNQQGENNGVNKWAMTDEYFRFTAGFESSRPVHLARYPIETVSQSEGGFESNYQGTCFFALVPLSLQGGRTEKINFTLTLRKWND